MLVDKAFPCEIPTHSSPGLQNKLKTCSQFLRTAKSETNQDDHMCVKGESILPNLGGGCSFNNISFYLLQYNQ